MLPIRAGLAAPLQAVLQHTPSTQLPLAHWYASVHAVPLLSFGTHEPAGQWLPEVQSLSSVHDVAHAVAPHM